MLVERGGDLLIGSFGRHRPMPQPSLRVIHDGGQGSVGCLALSVSSGLPYGRADQRVAKAHLAIDNFDKPSLHCGFERIAGHGNLLKQPYAADHLF